MKFKLRDKAVFLEARCLSTLPDYKRIIEDALNDKEEITFTELDLVQYGLNDIRATLLSLKEDVATIKDKDIITGYTNTLIDTTLKEVERVLFMLEDNMDILSDKAIDISNEELIWQIRHKML